MVWNNARSVEQFRGTFFSVWNISVEQFFSVEHFGQITCNQVFCCCKWVASTRPGPVIASNLQELTGIATYLQLDTIYYIAKKTALYITI